MNVDRTESTLLCVANFPSDTGYAWDFISSLYAGLADRRGERGGRTFVAYPSLLESPAGLRGSRAVPIESEFLPSGVAGLVAAVRLVIRLRVRILYLSDRPIWHPGYAILRVAGVRRIVVHDHTSGSRTSPGGAKRVLKRLRRWLPGTHADAVIAVSDFVARRKLDVDQVPRDRLHRVWNSVEIPASADFRVERRRLCAGLGIDPARPLVACACRASASKGVDVLLRAFDRLVSEWSEDISPVLVYAGDGPELSSLEAIRRGLESRPDILFLGYVENAADAVLGPADVCVVPSVWEEAFGLAALEPMARGRAVIATRVGGLPEVIEDDVAGVLVEPRDDAGLATAMDRLLRDEEARRRLGAAGRARAQSAFGRDGQISRLAEIVELPSPAR